MKITRPLLSLFVVFLAAPFSHGAGLPPFLKVDGVYIFDGNGEDLVKVLEVSDTGWCRVQTKAGESWVNVSNVTTIAPVSRETAMTSELRGKADFVRDEAMAISTAIDDYAAKNNLPMTASFKWEDIRKFIPSGTPAYNSGGKDITGRPFIFGAKVGDHVKVNADTIKECAPVIDDADGYWGKFKP